MVFHLSYLVLSRRLCRSSEILIYALNPHDNDRFANLVGQGTVSVPSESISALKHHAFVSIVRKEIGDAPPTHVTRFGPSLRSVPVSPEMHTNTNYHNF